ncbi:MAG: hypothetical protein JJE23_04975 [Thermoleophilia bacterium]|nr:hypothetical protein [Thermoleophilia bacterium]
MSDGPLSGVLFPEVEGRRSTTETGRAIFADAAAQVDKELAERISSCAKWRGEYLVHVRDLTAASAADPNAPVQIASAGLDSMRARMTFERDGQVIPVSGAGSPGLGREKMPETLTINGTGSPAGQLVVPYEGADLSGDELVDQLRTWVERGTVEPSFAGAIERVIENPEWLSMPGRRLALLGAASEMGPYEPLLAWGADLIAIDIPRPSIWERLLEVAAGSAGRVALPVRGGAAPMAERAGIDLREDLPETIAWIREAAGSDPLVIGTYAYLDGGRHVQVSAAADVLADEMLSRRPDTAIAYLATPTDAFVVGPEVVAEARRKWASRRLRAAAQAPLRLASAGRLFHPSYERQLPGGGGVADALVPIQGPNYALAKRLQRWRGILARDAGHRVSFNVAPSSWTRSVTQNRILAAAYSAGHHFGIEVFEPSTSRVLMAAMLVHDLNYEGDSARKPVAHPEELFSEGANHGGLWRAAYEPRSALSVAAIAGLPSTLRR